MVDEEEIFEDRRLYETDKNIFSLECNRIKAAAIAQGLTEDEIQHLDFDFHMEIQERLETIELIYQLVDEFLLVYLSRKMGIHSDIAEYLGSAFDDGIVPLMNDYNGD